jgi:hypothetical protein
MNEELKKVIVGLLQYSLDGIDWDFKKLTASEKVIVGDQATLDELKKFCS